MAAISFRAGGVDVGPAGPRERRRGLAEAVTAHLARNALEEGAKVVFVSAQGLVVAGVYERVGFRRVGTAGPREPVEVMASSVPGCA